MSFNGGSPVNRSSNVTKATLDVAKAYRASGEKFINSGKPGNDVYYYDFANRDANYLQDIMNIAPDGSLNLPNLSPTNVNNQ